MFYLLVRYPEVVGMLLLGSYTDIIQRISVVFLFVRFVDELYYTNSVFALLHLYKGMCNIIIMRTFASRSRCRSGSVMATVPGEIAKHFGISRHVCTCSVSNTVNILPPWTKREIFPYHFSNISGNCLERPPISNLSSSCCSRNKNVSNIDGLPSSLSKEAAQRFGRAACGKHGVRVTQSNKRYETEKGCGFQNFRKRRKKLLQLWPKNKKCLLEKNPVSVTSVKSCPIGVLWCT